MSVHRLTEDEAKELVERIESGDATILVSHSRCHCCGRRTSAEFCRECRAKDFACMDDPDHYTTCYEKEPELDADSEG